MRIILATETEEKSMETRQFGNTEMQVSIPGVHTAIVGTATPGRWEQNARLVGDGNLRPELFDEIRACWEVAADQHRLTQG
jgi:hypothetical protein